MDISTTSMMGHDNAPVSILQPPQQQQDPTSSSSLLYNEVSVIRRAGKQAVQHFLSSQNCFAVLKTSTKVVVFDIRIPIQLAFYALVEHDMLAAPLWDPVQCQFVGLFTVTDFIDLLYHSRTTSSSSSSTQLAVQSIGELLTQLKSPGASATGTTTTTSTTAPSEEASTAASTPTTDPSTTTTTVDNVAGTTDTSMSNNLSLLRPFCGAATQCSLLQACRQLLTSGHDFLPICFTNDMRVLACITYTTILEHLVTHFREQRRLFDDTIYDLNIGTYNTTASTTSSSGSSDNNSNKIIMVTPQHTLAEALQLMIQHQLSAIPVVDSLSNRRVVGMYSRSDITFLTKATDAEDAVRNLDLPLADILSQSRPDVTTPDALRTCSPHHTLQAIFESFAIQRFNRLCVVDAEERLMGIVSAKDLVAYFFEE